MEALIKAYGIGPSLGAGFLVLSYFFVALDRQRANSVTKDDTQVGLKLVLFAIALAGIAFAVDGVEKLLSYMLGGFKGGSLPMREAMPKVLVGAGATAAVLFALLPRTNFAAHRQAERFFLGALAVLYAGSAIDGLEKFLEAIFLDAKGDGKWATISQGLTKVIVFGGVGGFALLRFGQVSGWRMAPPAPPPAQYPPQGGGGYPPQGGGYPPQGGGYPPQGGGYPPQQGGGGYPQQGGGGSGSYGGGGSGGYPPPA